MSNNSKLLKFEGHNYLRQRLILATLSGRPVRIDKIRSDDHDPGIRGKLNKMIKIVLNIIKRSKREGYMY